MGNSPATTITIPDNEVIRDEDVKRDKTPLSQGPWPNLSESDNEFAKTIGLHPTDIGGVTNTALAVLGFGLGNPKAEPAPASVPDPKLFPKKQPLAIPDATSTAPGAQRWEGPTPPPRQTTPFPTVQPKSSLAVSPEQPRPQWFPEPRPETPIDRPGSMWSVERETLPGRAQRGQPGALDVLTNVSTRPPLVTPRPQIGNADPEFTGMRDRLFGELGYKSSQIATPGAPEGSSSPIPQGSPTPFPKLKRPPEEAQ